MVNIVYAIFVLRESIDKVCFMLPVKQYFFVDPVFINLKLLFSISIVMTIFCDAKVFDIGPLIALLDNKIGGYKVCSIQG